MDGADNIISVTKRVTAAMRLRSPYSDKYRPASTPTGVLIKVQQPTNIKLPTMALARPPPSEPGAGVLAVNNDRSIAESPLNSNTPRIQDRNSMPKPIADIDKARPILLVRLRLAKMAESILEVLFMFLTPASSPY